MLMLLLTSVLLQKAKTIANANADANAEADTEQGRLPIQA